MCSEACPYTDHCYCMQGMYAVLATEVETQGILGTHHNYLDVSIVRVILEVRYAPDEVKGCD